MNHHSDPGHPTPDDKWRRCRYCPATWNSCQIMRRDTGAPCCAGHDHTPPPEPDDTETDETDQPRSRPDDKPAPKRRPAPRRRRR